MKAWWTAFVLAAATLGTFANAQSFDKLYDESAQPELAAPLQWVAIPKSGDLPADENPLGGPAAFIDNPSRWSFKNTTSSTLIPTSTTHDVWMHFTLAPTTTPQTWYLRFPRVNPVKVSLHARDLQGNWQTQSAGNLVAPAQWPMRTRAPTFEVKTSSTLPLTFFMSFENQSPMAERLQMLSAFEYIMGAYGVGAMLGLLMGAFSLLTVLCLMAFALAWNTVFLWLAVFVASMLFNQLVLLGFAGWQLWPQSQHFNQNMPWVSSFFAMAAGTWLMARSSYAQDTHRWIYRTLAAIASLSLSMAAVTAIDMKTIPFSGKTAWTCFVVLSVVGAMVWLTLRGNRFNGWLLLGLIPIGLAGLNRLAYDAGWLAQLEITQIIGLLASALGLLVLFLALVWRSRAALFFSGRTQALADYDIETGLLVAEKAKTRLPRLLLRGHRTDSGSGVILLRWVDAVRYAGLSAGAQRSQILRQIGNLMRDAGRDIDSLIRHDENHFLILVEGPISRDALSEMASQILAASLRGADQLPSASACPAVNLHIAIWQETVGTTTANNVMALLMRRLNMMGKTTPRRVQFIDSAVSDQALGTTFEQRRRKQDVLNKIRAIEAAPIQPVTLRKPPPVR